MQKLMLCLKSRFYTNFLALLYLKYCGMGFMKDLDVVQLLQNNPMCVRGAVREEGDLVYHRAPWIIAGLWGIDE